MTPRTNTKLPQQNAPTPHAASSSQTPPSNYLPSVPISIYRQVSTELQSTQTLLESIKTQNQQLVEQNQQLRREIERVVQSTLQLRQVADTHKPLNLDRSSAPEAELETPVESPIASLSVAPTPAEPRPHPKATTTETMVSLKQVTEQESHPRRSPAAERSQEVGGWWLVLIILLIVITAFGTGFLIVRPLLPNR